MRVVINALGARVGGGITYLLNLLPELPKVNRTHEYAVLVRPEVAARLARARLPEGMSVLSLTVRGILHRVLLEQVWLPIVLRRVRADLVYGPAEIVPLAAPCPAVVACRNANLYTDRDVGWRGAARLHFAAQRQLAIRSVRQARGVISVSEAWCDAIARTAGIGRDRISVVPHGVSDAFRRLGEARLAAGRGTAGDGSWLSVSTIYRYKNYDTLVDSVALLRARGMCLKVAIVGGNADPEYHRRLQCRIRRRAVDGQVQLLGAIDHDEVQRLYGKAAGFVFPSWLETFGHPILEAMATAVPVVAADIPVFRELAGATVLYAKPFDATSLADAMEAVVHDPVAAEARARRGAERSGVFSWRRTAALTVAVFEHAAQTTGTRQRQLPA